VESVLANFRKSKTDVLTTFEALQFDFWKNVPFENVKSAQKFRVAQMIKIVVFGASK